MVSSQLACLSPNHIHNVPCSGNGAEFDFSDVFGPLSDQPSLKANPKKIRGSDAIFYQALELDALAVYETAKEGGRLRRCVDESAAEEGRGVGPEDFEILKVVGEGAFGKVYQVRRIGTCEIYAMKVMRKDRILERNHAEYMNSEREILTKLDHPFIVRLRYSFQVF